MARPDQRVREAAMGVAYALEVLEWNHRELNAAFENASQGRRLNLDVSVRIHNYAASVYSLLSTYRLALPAVVRRRTESSGEFDRRLAEVFDSDLGCFVLSLREYCQHYRNPTEFSFGWSIGQNPEGPERRLRLEPEPLLLYLESRRGGAKRRATAAARYVRSSPLALDLWEVAAALEIQLDGFIPWFDDWYRVTYRAQLDALDCAEWEVAYALLAWRLDLLDDGDYPGHIVYQALGEDIGLNRFSVMLGNLEGTVLDALNQRYPVDADLEALIRHAFGRWADVSGIT